MSTRRLRTLNPDIHAITAREKTSVDSSQRSTRLAAFRKSRNERHGYSPQPPKRIPVAEFELSDYLWRFALLHTGVGKCLPDSYNFCRNLCR